MTKVFLTDTTLTPIERPRCARCQTRMMLARITPLPDGSEQRTFECPKCNLKETTRVADPLKSRAVERLTANVRPPV
jgi:DNA-directed RNA polymerase subunit RPC12/RpoP